MNRMIRYAYNLVLSLTAVILLTTSIFSCEGGGDGIVDGDDKEPLDTAGKYINPVFEPVLADPTVIEADDGWFYAYGTEDAWGTGASHLVPIIKSKDLVNWQFVKDAFVTKPDWKEDGFIWAPDINYINDQYYLFYSYSLWGDSNPGIGVATSDQPEGPFTDQGKLFQSTEIGVSNSIDPFFIEENGVKYLFWGSFQGIFGVELTNDATAIKGDKFQIAGTFFEGTYIHNRNGYYYFFGSSGSCCDGANSSYHVTVARSENLKGPYIDKQGRSIMDGEGTLFLKGNSLFAGPGHNAEIVTDDAGNDWFIYHAIDKSQPHLPNGATRRPLMLDKIEWQDDWPVIINQIPGSDYQEDPVFE